MNTPIIIFEDQSIIIVNKAAGMIVNRADTTRNVETLQDLIDTKVKSQKGRAALFSQAQKLKVKNEDSDFIKRSGIVHRLDKETSGLIIVAKDTESFTNLQNQFKAGKVEKKYITLVHGRVIPEKGEINVPIGRLPWNRMRFGILPSGRESKTLYQVVAVWEKGNWEIFDSTNFSKIFKPSPSKSKNSSQIQETLSLVEVSPKTGRTHQIRVHFRYINHAIFADELYAGRKVMKRDRKILPRHFLHASYISFIHPKTNIQVTFSSSLPADLIDFLSTLN